MQLATRNLARLRELYKNLAISQRELDQAASDQQNGRSKWCRATRLGMTVSGCTGNSKHMASAITLLIRQACRLTGERDE